MDIWAEADWIIDLGPEGGDRGGEVTIQAPPEELAKHNGHTGRLLGAFLKERVSLINNVDDHPRQVSTTGSINSVNDQQRV